MKNILRLAVLPLAVFFLGACNGSPAKATPTIDEALRITQAVQTVYAQITSTARAAEMLFTPTKTSLPPTETPIPPTVTPAFTNTPAFTLTPTLTLTSTPAPVSHCPLAQVTRQTLPPGSNVIQGQWLVRQWWVLNTGDCPWTTDFAIVYYDGERFGLPLVRNFHKEVQPGDFIVITFEFAAPDTPGVYTSWWMMRTTTGELFGNGPGDTPLYIEINVQKNE